MGSNQGNDADSWGTTGRKRKREREKVKDKGLRGILRRKTTEDGSQEDKKNDDAPDSPHDEKTTKEVESTKVAERTPDKARPTGTSVTATKGGLALVDYGSDEDDD